MKITVLGASGLIGSKLVNLLRQQGYDVVLHKPGLCWLGLDGSEWPHAVRGLVGGRTWGWASFTIAATDPICPRCGTTLFTLVALEGSLERQLSAEVGPVFDFVRSLA